MEITILEGARGTGKSTLAFKLRQRTPETTLINFTGFHTDGEEGLSRVSDYYKTWITFLLAMGQHESNYVFDRFYFSEQVFSKLYKEYDFTDNYELLNDFIEDLSFFGVKINIFFLTINDEEELKQRLIRDKVPFGKAEESVTETLAQQAQYAENFRAFQFMYANDNLKVHTVDTSGKTNEQVYEEIQKLKTT